MRREAGFGVGARAVACCRLWNGRCEQTGQFGMEHLEQTFLDFGVLPLGDVFPEAVGRREGYCVKMLSSVRG